MNPLNYENQPCAHCGNPLREGEDVVVCPVCATPQHRECWMQAGHCANDELHSSGYVWKKENINHTAKIKETESTNRVCHICGSENPSDSLHCGNCGALFGESENKSEIPKQCAYCGTVNDSDARHCKNCGAPLVSGGGFFTENPYLRDTGLADDEMIGENTAGDLALFVQASSRRYLPKFKRFAKGKKLSFNFAAFFFAPYWFFYRKIYKAGAFFTVMFVAASLMLSGLSTDISETAYQFTEKYGTFDYEAATEEEILAYEDELLKASEKFYNEIKNPVLIVAGVTFAMNLICALCADYLYYKKILADMKIINDSVKDKNMKKMMIARRGGLSPLAFAASLLGYNSLINILVYFADMIMTSF